MTYIHYIIHIYYIFIYLYNTYMYNVYIYIYIYISIYNICIYIYVSGDNTDQNGGYPILNDLFGLKSKILLNCF